MASPLQSILQQEMDRKDFIKYVGATLFFVAGGGMLVKAAQSAAQLSQAKSQSTTQSNTLAYGYGADVYGGSVARQSASSVR